MVVPTRGQDWYDNGRWLEIHRQNWTPTSPSGLSDINSAWVNDFSGIAAANIVLAALEGRTVMDSAEQAGVVAELRALRAFYYYQLMDLFGGVPIVTTTEIKPRARNTRAEVFQFIESELLAVRPVLPPKWDDADRKSTRLNSSHGYISYAVFCLKKKKTNISPHNVFQLTHGR